MRTLTKFFTLSLILAVHVSGSANDPKSKQCKDSYGAPGFETSIEQFERKDHQCFPPLGGVLVTGSSHIRKWKTIHEDLAPLTIIHRGYGGSTFNDALHYAERIMIPYKPRAIVIYTGNNDLNCGVSPETVRDTCQAFVEKVRSQLPNVRFYVVSIPPAVLRWKGRDDGMWPDREKANHLIKEYCDANGIPWIDTASGMFGPDGNPRKEIFGPDDLHMNREGYYIWRDAILPVLLKHELPKERGK